MIQIIITVILEFQPIFYLKHHSLVFKRLIFCIPYFHEDMNLYHI